MGNIIFEPIALAATVVYPAYRSYKCLEHADKYDSRQWLTYWIVFAALFVVDHLFGWFLEWVPFYWTAKFIFLCLCAYLNGATFLYSRYVKPFLASKEEEIDRGLGKGFNFVSNKLKGTMTKAAENGAAFAVMHSDEIMGQFDIDKVNEGEMI